MDLFKKNNKNEKAILALPSDFLLLQQSVQDLLPFDDIRDSMICLPGDLYRAVIEVKSINYYLKTAEEQQTLENQFRAALGSWDFSFAFYTQTRTIEADDIINKLQSDVDTLTSRELRTYGREYIEEMTRLTKARNGNLIKRNYIIISCNDAGTIVNNKTTDDKDTYAFEKLNLDRRKVEESLAPMGLSCHVLNNQELLELLFVAINKHSLLKADEILSFMSNITSGPSEWDMSKVDLLLEGLITELRNMMLTNHDMSADEYEKAQNIIKEVESIRDRNYSNENDLFVL